MPGPAPPPAHGPGSCAAAAGPPVAQASMVFVEDHWRLRDTASLHPTCTRPISATRGSCRGSASAGGGRAACTFTTASMSSVLAVARSGPMLVSCTSHGNRLPCTVMSQAKSSFLTAARRDKRITAPRAAMTSRQYRKVSAPAATRAAASAFWTPAAAAARGIPQPAGQPSAPAAMHHIAVSSVS